MINGQALAFRPTRYRDVRTITEGIDEAISGPNRTLTQAQDVRGWIDNPEKIDPRIVGNLERFAGLLKPGARVLDVGCFGGYAFDWLSLRVPGLIYVGADVLPEAVAAAYMAHQDEENATWTCGDLFDLADVIDRFGPFDAALCLRVVIHTGRLGLALGQLTKAAPVALVGLRTGKDRAVERLDEISGETHFYRTFSLETVEAAIPEGMAWSLHDDGAYQSLVVR